MIMKGEVLVCEEASHEETASRDACTADAGTGPPSRPFRLNQDQRRARQQNAAAVQHMYICHDNVIDLTTYR